MLARATDPTQTSILPVVSNGERVTNTSRPTLRWSGLWPAACYSYFRVLAWAEAAQLEPLGRHMTRSRKTLVAIAFCAVVLAIPFALGAADILAALLDNQVGVVTHHAIRAVRALPSGPTTVGALMTRRYPNARWDGQHADDDSLFSVRVSSEGAEWCVAYTLAYAPVPHMHLADIAPANRAAQAISGALGSRYSLLPNNNSWACAAIRTYFRKTSRSARSSVGQ